MLAARLVDPAHRPLLVVLLGANPLVLIHLIGGAHLDALAAALLMGALVLARGGRVSSDTRRRIAIVVCTTGAMVKLPVGLGVVFLMVSATVLAVPGRRVRLLAGDAVAAGAAVGLSVVLSGTGLGWLRNFGTPGRLRTAIAPADLLANLLRGAGWLVGIHTGGSEILAGARLAALAAGVVLVGWLLLPRRRAGGWNPPTLDRLGLALLALGLLGPVLYAWYLAPALPLLALAACRDPRPVGSGRPAAAISPPAAQRTSIILSVVLTFAAIPTLAPAWHVLGRHSVLLAVVALAAAAGAACWLTVRLRRVRTPAAPAAVHGEAVGIRADACQVGASGQLREARGDRDG